jgi:hypothetical protein
MQPGVIKSAASERNPSRRPHDRRGPAGLRTRLWGRHRHDANWICGASASRSISLTRRAALYTSHWRVRSGGPPMSDQGSIAHGSVRARPRRFDEKGGQKSARAGRDMHQIPPNRRLMNQGNLARTLEGTWHCSRGSPNPAIIRARKWNSFIGGRFFDRSSRGRRARWVAMMKVLRSSSVPLWFPDTLYILEGSRLQVPYLPEVPGRARLGANNR